MTMLVTVPELSLWAEGATDVIDPSDPLAQWLIEQASTLVIDECRQPTWIAQTAPNRAKIVVANIAKRCWNNSDQETRTSIAGGPGSTVLDEAALGLRLSDAEVIECAKIRQSLLDEATTGDPGGFWTLSISRGPLETSMLVGDDRWPESSPMEFMSPALDPYYFPTHDQPLPVAGPDAEPTNAPL